MGEDKARAKEAGFDDYLTKPLDVPLLFSVLDRLLPEGTTVRAASAA